MAWSDQARAASAAARRAKGTGGKKKRKKPPVPYLQAKRLREGIEVTHKVTPTGKRVPIVKGAKPIEPVPQKKVKSGTKATMVANKPEKEIKTVKEPGGRKVKSTLRPKRRAKSFG